MYPHGQADCGALDMSGNLSEWCLNDYKNPEVMDGFGNGKRKVLRGGSFLLNPHWARALSRNNFNPYNRNPYNGFRVVCVPILGG